MTQTSIDDAEVQDLSVDRNRWFPKPVDPANPPQNNYELIRDELFWIRKELQDIGKLVAEQSVEHSRDLYDTNVMLGYLAKQVKIWVEVAE